MLSGKLLKKIKSMVVVGGCSGIIFSGFLYYRNDEKFFDSFAMPLTRRLFDAESAHKFGIFCCKWNLLPANTYEDPKSLVSSHDTVDYNKIFLNLKFCRKQISVVSN
jgi:hypothetical protein